MASGGENIEHEVKYFAKLFLNRDHRGWTVGRGHVKV